MRKKSLESVCFAPTAFPQSSFTVRINVRLPVIFFVSRIGVW